MNLYRIWQGQNCSYDTYDSAVVAAESEDGARLIHPSSLESDNPYMWSPETQKWQFSYVATYDGQTRVASDSGQWANSPQGVKVELIGVAVDGTEEGVICASFNAG